MWVCPKCGEPHEDQFKVCWKCAGEEMAPAYPGPVAPVAPPVERRLRPLSSILLRAASGFLLGFIFGAMASHRVMPAFMQPPGEYDWLTAAVTLGLCAGIGLGVLVGLFFWVAFPYEPIDSATKTPQQNP
jgi:hypothetical protein